MGAGSTLERNIESLVENVSRLQANVESMTESIGFIIENMATKSDLKEVENRLDEKIDTAEQRVSQRIDGVSNRLDYELDWRKQLEVRVTRLEKKPR